jgi:hypothetical protein
LATFTFFGPETRAITKLLKNREIGIFNRTKNIKHLLRIKENHNDKYDLSGISIAMWKLPTEINRTGGEYSESDSKNT